MGILAIQFHIIDIQYINIVVKAIKAVQITKQI